MEHDSDDSDDFWDSGVRRMRARYASKQAAKPLRKKRKLEEQPRSLRYDHLFAKGDRRRRRLDPDKSPWWDIIRHPDVRDPFRAPDAHRCRVK
jgi:hypothetical protein